MLSIFFATCVFCKLVIMSGKLCFATSSQNSMHIHFGTAQMGTADVAGLYQPCSAASIFFMDAKVFCGCSMGVERVQMLAMVKW